MKRFIFVFTLLCMLCLVSGCRSDSGQQRSTFYSTFSIGEIVAVHEQFLLPDSRVLSGTEAGPATPPYQKHEEMIVQIDMDNVPRFLEAIKTDIEQALVDSGARIDGRGGSFQDPVAGQVDIDYISFRYSQDKVNGIINIYGIRSEGTNYVLIIVLTES
ncbi:hypothetical protein AMJ86_10510 [bacterium SM23_57]|jgi:hypothetical protein|nr:MAG: hypothetical protein AMJ86_10510 [bacterium SM23_57]